MSSLVEVSHLGLECLGRSSSNKKPRPIGIFRAIEEEGSFWILCPHCKRVLEVLNEALVHPERHGGLRNGLKYLDVSHRYEGK